MDAMSRMGWQNNVKQVIRIALIGLQPSEQVTIKGYLRIILRVDFDIEWVTPKNPSLTFFIIGKQFAGAESVVSMLAESNSPVLYVDRHESISNTIQDNTLYLKLENTKILQRWLHENIDIIGSDGNFVAERAKSPSTPSVEADVISQVSEVQTHYADAMSTTSELEEFRASVAPVNQTASNTYITSDIVDLIREVNTIKSDALYNISCDGNLIAIMQPSTRLVWPRGDSFFPNFTLNWTVSPSDKLGLLPKHAMNLHQWLWECAVHPQTQIQEIISSSAKVRIKTWPKPVQNTNKSDYLKILALTEMKAVSAECIRDILGIHIKTAHECIAALYLSGFLDLSGLPTPEILVKAQIRPATNNQNNIQANNEQAQHRDDGILVSGTEVISRADDEKVEQKKSAMKSGGFNSILSRIRSTLGF